jgi:small subunit ribosomal protein S4
MPVTRPRLKILRRLGVQLPGLTRKDAERRPTPPGQQGPTGGRRRKSDYRLQLEEKQKIRFNYGVSETQLRRAYDAASREPGRTGDNMLARLERRLCNVVFRLGFAPTIPAARQLVSHGHVLVNGRRVDRPSYLLGTGEVIAMSDRGRTIPAVIDAVTRGPQVKVPSYAVIDPEDPYRGRVIATPARQDTPLIVDEAAVIEFYAR